jgi:hypothetical protein
MTFKRLFFRRLGVNAIFILPVVMWMVGWTFGAMLLHTMGGK